MDVGEANPGAKSSDLLDLWLVTLLGNTQGLPEVSGLSVNYKALSTLTQVFSF